MNSIFNLVLWSHLTGLLIHSPLSLFVWNSNYEYLIKFPLVGSLCLGPARHLSTSDMKNECWRGNFPPQFESSHSALLSMVLLCVWESFVWYNFFPCSAGQHFPTLQPFNGSFLLLTAWIIEIFLDSQTQSDLLTFGPEIPRLVSMLSRHGIYFDVDVFGIHI